MFSKLRIDQHGTVLTELQEQEVVTECPVCHWTDCVCDVTTNINGENMTFGEAIDRGFVAWNPSNNQFALFNQPRNIISKITVVYPETYTHTARFRFKDGLEVEIPEPGEGWERLGEPDVYDWPNRYVSEATKDSVSFYADIDVTTDFIDIIHEMGKCWLYDFYNILDVDFISNVPRVLWIQRWKHIGIDGPEPERYDGRYEFL